MICPHCQAEPPEDARFCDRCGHVLSEGPMAATPPVPAPPELPPTCPSCAQPVMVGEAFCSACGSRLTGAGQGGAVLADGSASVGLPPTIRVGAQDTFRCARCGATQSAGAAFCDVCGAPLVSGAPVVPRRGANPPPPPPGARVPPQHESDLTSPPMAPPPPGWPGAPAGRKTELIPPIHQPPVPQSEPARARLLFAGAGAEFPLVAGQRLVIGRADPASRWMPDVDLDACHALDLGVSRRHAEIWWETGRWYVADLDTVNHTFVNHRLLAKTVQHPLNPGDEIRLGRLILTFHTA